jgi:hypothetical protein
MSTPIELCNLFAYEGPNITGPQPGVLLRVRCDEDRSVRLKDALKDAAQFIGMVLAYLDMHTTHEGSHVVISASFATPTPALGAELARYVVEGISREASRPQGHAEDDEEDEDSPPGWDPDAPLVALQQRQRAERLPMPALQLMAEARARGLPVLWRPDGLVQVGYGVQHWRFDPAALTNQEDDDDEDETDAANGLHWSLPQPDWERISMPAIYVVTGERNRRAVCEQVATLLHARQHRDVTVLHEAGFDETRHLLTSAATPCVVIGLDTADILRRGIAFTTCTQAIITDIDGAQPAEAAYPAEWVQALGVPMLVSHTPAILDINNAALASLVPYAPHGALSLTALETSLVS